MLNTIERRVTVDVLEELADLLTSEQQSSTFALLATVCTHSTKDAINANLINA